MKLLRTLFIVGVMVVLVGIGVNYYGTKMVSDKVVEQVSTQLENSEEIEKIKEKAKNDPKVQKFISEGASVEVETNNQEVQKSNSEDTNVDAEINNLEVQKDANVDAETNNPEVQKGENIDAETLPFQTKEEAIREVVKKFNVIELNEVRSDLQNGNNEEVLNKLQEKLTEEEILALKRLAYKELNK